MPRCVPPEDQMECLIAYRYPSPRSRLRGPGSCWLLGRSGSDLRIVTNLNEMALTVELQSSGVTAIEV
jgi:hypothetical protein